MMRNRHFFNSLVLASVIGVVLAAEDISLQDGIPQKKLISTFQIVRFPNEACEGTSNRNGTCYTSAECSDKGGTSAGSCADGFGVCCTFVINACEKTVAENITYWDAPAAAAYESTTAPFKCGLTVCPMNDNICQLRIDFTTFVITGPSTSSVSENHKKFGNSPVSSTAANAGTVNTVTNWKSNCLVDTFSISGLTPANQPPMICGTNTGFHMYVDANTAMCNHLNFNFMPVSGPSPALAAGNTNFGADTRGVAATVTRDWDMTIYQYDCGYINSAPPGCTQYLFGPPAGEIYSYNWSLTGKHLADQNQKVCIRREKAYCAACFATDGIVTSFDIGATSSAQNTLTFPGLPCGYNCEDIDGESTAAGNACAGYDCVIIPGAFVVAAQATGTTFVTTTANAGSAGSLVAATYRVPAPPQITGILIFGAGNADVNAITVIGAATPATICTQHVPFQLTFKSDGFEGTGVENEFLRSAEGTGIKINYALATC